MKKLCSLFLFFGSIMSAFAQDVGPALDSLIRAYTKINKFNGTVLVARHGKILLRKGYGYQNVAEKIRNTEKSVFQIGSVTKQFTSAVILKLQEEKKLDVSDKVSKYFPDYPKGDSISIHQLLTHTSGIYNYTGNGEFMRTEITKPQSREKMMSLFKDKPFDFTPGSRWSYSNSGYSLLGYIIEVVTGKSYEAAVYKYIFEPAKMSNSGFDFSYLKSPYKTSGYFTLNLADTVLAPITDSTIAFSAGAIYSTTGDMYKWHNSLQNNTILSKMQQETAYTPVKNGYGYGWFIDSVEGKRRVGHSGGIPGYISMESRVPEEDIFILLLSNASDKSLKDIMKSIYAILYKKEYEMPKQRKAITMPDAVLQQYKGEYEINAGFTIVITVKGAGLGVQPTGDVQKIMLPEKEDSFFEDQDEIKMVFTRNDKKEVTGLVLHQNGRQTICKKR
ncbi:MAG: serine hydrolase [Sphingobacteriales bacterium]|nr:MAG: serine hydrolase [Sphingobacteriales bacterium]